MRVILTSCLRSYKPIGRPCTSPFEDPYLINVTFGYNSLNFQAIATKIIYILDLTQ